MSTELGRPVPDLDALDQETSTAPDPVELTEAADERVHVDTDPEAFFTQLYFAQRTRPRRIALMPRLIGQAALLVWRTSRVQTLGIGSLQVGAAAISALQVLLAGFAARELLALRPGQAFGHVFLPLSLLALLVLISAIATGGQSQLGQLLGVRVEREVTHRVLDVAENVDLITYDDADFYDQLSRVMANVLTTPFTVVTCLAGLLGGAAGVIALSASLLVVQPVLLPIVLVSSVPLWYLSRRSGRLEWDFAVAQTTGLRERQYLTEVLTERAAAAELRAYATAPRLRRRFDVLFEEFIQATRTKVRRQYRLRILSGLAVGLIMILTLLLLVVLIDQRQITVAEGAASAVAIRLLGARLQQLFSGVGQLFQSGLFLEDYDEFVQRAPIAQEHRSPAATPPETPAVDHIPAHRPAPVPRHNGTAGRHRSSSFQGLHLEHVSFAYPGTSRPALRDVSIDIRPGEVVALVGENGSGKTTLAKILGGLYLPTQGTMSWNGSKVSDRAGQSAVRDQTALVLQDFLHYAMTATENIAYGRPELEPSASRVRDAASRIGADTFLDRLPAGFDTRLSRMFEGGRELSLGQWQRIALARVFYRDSPVVILDEPTAALDPRAEHQLYESMREVMRGRTVLLITHRMNSVRGADRIVVLAEGRVIEQGTHDSLMADAGTYAELVTLQNMGGITGKTG